jgi:soluble lytic murein transglycosylase-like protein
VLSVPLALLLTPMPCPDLSELGISFAIVAPVCRIAARAPVGAGVAKASRLEQPLIAGAGGAEIDRALKRPSVRAAAKSLPLNPRLTPIYKALSNCRASLPEGMRWRIANAIEEQSRRHGYDPLFVQAMIEVESTCSPTARSNKGAIGLIQLQPATARAVAEAAGIHWVGPQTLLDPARNVEIGLLYLSQLEEQLGDPHLAVAAYNLGPGRVAGKPKRFGESSGYVRKILNRYERLLEASAT